MKNDSINTQIGLTIHSLLISAHRGTVNVLASLHRITGNTTDYKKLNLTSLYWPTALRQMAQTSVFLPRFGCISDNRASEWAENKWHPPFLINRRINLCYQQFLSEQNAASRFRIIPGMTRFSSLLDLDPHTCMTPHISLALGYH